ncbi:MAG: Hpt domain-containing protein [Pseudomonadota bacterium]
MDCSRKRALDFSGMIARRDPLKHRRLVAELVDDLRRSLSGLETDSEATHWQSTLHKAKGSAALLGAANLAALAGEFYDSPPLTSREDVAAQINALKSALDELEAVIATDAGG